jgi:hypothetical protein
VSDLDADLEAALRTTLVDHAGNAPAGDDLADTVVRVGRTRRRRRRVAGTVAVLAIGAVAGLAGRSLVPFAGDGDPDPAATAPAKVQAVTCGSAGWPPFDPALLAERPALDPSSELGTAVTTTGRPPVAADLITGWTLVEQTGPTAYLLMWLRDEAAAQAIGMGNPAAVTYTQASGGTWSFTGGGACRVQSHFDDGLGPMEWRLDGGRPAPDATSVPILATELGCSNGRPADDRLGDPIVEYREDAVVITMRVAPPEGTSFECRDNPAAEVTVQLDEPLGDRELRDGTWYPARPVLPDPAVEP